MIDNKLKSILLSVQKPARYTGGEPGCIIKNKDEGDVRFAFCFPDTYEIGMSHLGMKILYDELNKQDYIWCERCFAPWTDMMAKMKEHNIPTQTYLQCLILQVFLSMPKTEMKATHWL